MNNKITKEHLVYIIMLLAAIILTIFGVLNDNKAGEILLNIGLSMISTVIVYFLLNFLSDDPMTPVINKVNEISDELSSSIELIKSSEETGIIKAWNTRSDFPITEWIKRINNSEGDIAIFCYEMAFLIDDSNFDDAIIRKLRAGDSVRILLGKPGGVCIHARTVEEKNEGNIDERIERAARRLLSINAKLPEDTPHKVEVRYHDTPLYASIYDFGSTMIVTPQLYAQRGALAPILELRKTMNPQCMYNKYNNMFEEIWHDSEEAK